MFVDALCSRYLVEHARFKKSAAGDKNIIDLHVRPVLGPTAVGAVRYADVARLHAKMQSTPYQANRVLSVLSKMFNLAELWELRPEGSNPCRHVKRYKERRRVRYLTDIELKAFISAVERRFEKQPLECGLLLLLLYTGARCGEIKAALWEHLSGTELHLPDTKTGERVVFMTPQALTVLARLPRARKWIAGPDINPRWVFASVLGDLKIKNFRIHDLRHCFASVGISADQSIPRIGGLLGHADSKATSIYAHLVPSEGRASALAIGRRFESIAS